MQPIAEATRLKFQLNNFMINSSRFKTAFSIALICVCVFHSFSQTVYSSDESSRFSFTAGMTSSNLINDTSHFQSAILCGGGFMYGITLSEKFNITANILYTGKAFKSDKPTVKYHYFYLDFPLYLQYKLGDNVRINLGGQYSQYTNSSIVVLDGGSASGVNIEKSTSIKDNDYGFLAGIEIDITDDISLAARYSASTSAFFEKNKVNFGVFQLSLNYDVYNSHRKFFHKKEGLTETKKL